MTSTKYFKSDKYTPDTLLKRDASGDYAFINGAWKPTKIILAYMAGEDDFVDDIDEAAARKLAPGAFKAS